MVCRSGRFAALSFAASCTLATATPITLDFEGIAPFPNNNTIQIRDYYDGGRAVLLNTTSYGPGPDWGVRFSTSAMLLCLNTLTVDCSSSSKGPGGPAGSSLAALHFDRTPPFINVEAGFEHQLSFWYSQPVVTEPLPNDTDVGIDIFDGLDGRGTLLARVMLPHTPNRGQACLDYGSVGLIAKYCPFEPFTLRFDGVARSVHFTGNANRSVFDDIVLGGNPPTPPTGNVPEPASAATGLLALAALWWTRRRQPAAGKACSSRSM